MDKHQIEALEKSMREEHERDLQALMRLKRFLPVDENKTDAPSMQAAPVVSQHAPLAPQVHPPQPPASPPREVESAVDSEGEVNTLRGAVGRTLASDPMKGWTGQKMLAHLRSENFPFQAKAPINSIAVAMNYWVKRDCAVVVRRGKGRAPNIVKWKQGVSFPIDIRVGDTLSIEDVM